jgi:cytochrome c
MSMFEFNKIAGAVLSALLVAMVIGTIGDSLVHPRKHEGAVAIGEGAKAPAAAPAAREPEKLEPVAPLLAGASVDKGKGEAKKCAVCHSFEKGAKAKIGPTLWGVVGAGKGSHEGFGYSSAMKGKGGTWTYEDLNAFLADPKGFVPGTRMTFAGVKSVQDRANLIAFLRSLADSPAPLP